eukprot:gnl/TRDRNA2_/TRDRNA2_38971_c0_seq1.p1 gnl/TRDRNA2_/TRDRNA2_38971_c0~~gnl/TRDRNA2_/TRDRNA2_38971_c0_seq1.p1  ORF type:complete len:321 (+),score=58.02 gnl/TRDRNA2_/TRDRNA2_38971_c0_seq1:133-963(+)
MSGVPLDDVQASEGMCLLIIDPQIDFHPPNGALQVAGALEDTDRIIKLLRKYSSQIGRIVVTLDTHHKMHIANPGFWMGQDGKNPSPFTIIEAQDIKAGKWKASQSEMNGWALEYATKLEAAGRFKICVWPEHCLLGSAGHACHPPLAEELNKWAGDRNRTVTWLLKGQNNRTEMFSALKAEVEIPSDPATQLNVDLIKKLAKNSKVLCCGQAKSHCVNYTVRDLVSGFPKGRVADIVVLEDCASSVPGFEAAGEAFIKDMKAAGCTVCKAADFKC